MKSFLHRRLALFSRTKTKLYVLSGLVMISSIFSLVFTQLPAEGMQAEQDTARTRVEPPQPKAPTSDQTTTPINGSQASQSRPGIKRVPVFKSSDFLAGYLDNRTSSIIVDGKPWINASTNVAQYQQEMGGTSFWDYWGENEDWTSPNHMWQDDRGKWHLYKTETIRLSDGKDRMAFVLLDREGPGVMDKLWFTNDAATSFFQVFNIFKTSIDPIELTQWGNLSKLGNLRIEVDDQIVYDGPIEDWFSGKAQHLTSELAQIFVWRYQEFGSDGNIIPIPYQKHIKVSVYGGSGKPKWFMATGVTLPEGTKLKPYTGSTDDLPLDEMARLAKQVLEPETYIDTLDNQKTYTINVAPGSPSAVEFKGSGTIAAMQIEIAKKYDLKNLRLAVKYGNDVGIDMPLIAFFGEPGQISLHHSSPLGIMVHGDSYLFYSNYPMPYQNGVRIEFSTNGGAALPLKLRTVVSNETNNTQLRVLYKPSQRLEVYGPDYSVTVEGDGKMVGLVLVTQDQEFSKVPKVYQPASQKEDPTTLAWGMGYLEGNLNMFDGTGNGRLYSGHEDWADGGYYFNSGYTTPPGGANRPFGGILRYKGGEDGYATLFRYFNDLSAFRFKDDLHLMFGHGTWKNNFAVKYGATVYYYRELASSRAETLPASEYITVTGTSSSSMP